MDSEIVRIDWNVRRLSIPVEELDVEVLFEGEHEVHGSSSGSESGL
jgi:hypothetical protein